RSQAASNASFSKKLPSAIASSIRARSCLTIAPAPRLRWPTSELPICPSGRPTSRPWAESWVWGNSSQRPSNTGVSANEIALPGPAGASPQPSRMTRASEGTDPVMTRPRRRQARTQGGPTRGAHLSVRDPRRPTEDTAWRRLEPSCRLADRGEVLRVEAGAADQRPVDVRLRQQLGRVGGLDRAAVEDPHRV